VWAKQVRDTQFLLAGEVTGKKCNGHRKSFQKRSITLKNAWLPYFLCYEMEVASLFNMSLVSGCEQKLFQLYFSSARGRLLEMLKVLLQ